MKIMHFKMWLEELSKLAPKENPIYDNGTNSDYNFGSTGAKSKYASPQPHEKSKIKPKKMFFGKNKKVGS